MANTQIVPISKNGTSEKATYVPEQRLPAEEEIRRTRQQIAATTTQIQQQMRSNLDWKLWVNRYPLSSVTLMVATGFLVGSALPSAATPRSSTRSKNKENPPSQQEIVEETGKNTVVATVLTNVALNVLREGSSYMIRRFFTDK
jgi:hypothetical protein